MPDELVQLAAAIWRRWRRKDFAGALPLAEQYCATARERSGPAGWLQFAYGLNIHGALLFQLGESGRADALLTEAMTIFRQTGNLLHPQGLDALRNLARVTAALGRYDEALTLHREAHAILTMLYGEDDPQAAASRRDLLEVQQLRDNMIAPPPPAAGAPVEEALKEEDAPLPIFIFDEEEEPEACNIARAVGAPARVETLPVEERMPADEGLSAIEEHAVVASDVEAAQPAQREQPAIGEVPAPIPEMPVLPAPARVELPAPPATAGMRSSLFTRRGAGYRGAFGFLFLTGEALVWRPAEGAAPVVLPYRRIAALGCPPDGRGFYLRLDGDAATHAFQVDRGAEWVDEMYRALRGACRDPLAATMARAYMERRAMPA